MDWTALNFVAFVGVAILTFITGWASAFRGRNDTPQDRDREMEAQAPGSTTRLRPGPTWVPLDQHERDEAVPVTCEHILSDAATVVGPDLRVQIAPQFSHRKVRFVDALGQTWFGKADAVGFVTLRLDPATQRDLYRPNPDARQVNPVEDKNPPPSGFPTGSSPEGLAFMGSTADPKGRVREYWGTPEQVAKLDGPGADGSPDSDGDGGD